MNAQHDGWITLDAYCEKYGERKPTVHKRVADGYWIRGVHYSAPTPHACYVHEERAAQWLNADRARRAQAAREVV